MSKQENESKNTETVNQTNYAGVKHYFRKRLPIQHEWINNEKLWITTGAAAWLESNINSSDNCLEYGGGGSTLWWAKTANTVTCVEASVEWTIAILTHAYNKPEILKKMRLFWAPAEWNPTSEFPKRYWGYHRGVLQPEDIIRLQTDLAAAEFSYCNVWVFDGSVRDYIFQKKHERARETAEIIVVDNTEDATHFFSAKDALDADFVRMDFIEEHAEKIPRHQNGKHITSIWVKDARLSRSPVPHAGGPTQLSDTEWFEYMGVSEDQRGPLIDRVRATMQEWAAHP